MPPCGTVKLTRTGRFSSSRPSARARSAGARHRIPHEERLPSQQPVVNRPQQMSTHPEEILHEAVHGHEALDVGGRLEAPHLALALTGRLVGDFGSIVRVLIRGVDHGRHHGTMSRRVTAQLVRDQPAGFAALSCQ